MDEQRYQKGEGMDSKPMIDLPMPVGADKHMNRLVLLVMNL